MLLKIACSQLDKIQNPMFCWLFDKRIAANTQNIKSNATKAINLTCNFMHPQTAMIKVIGKVTGKFTSCNI